MHVPRQDQDCHNILAVYAKTVYLWGFISTSQNCKKKIYKTLLKLESVITKNGTL